MDYHPYEGWEVLHSLRKRHHTAFSRVPHRLASSSRNNILSDVSRSPERAKAVEERLLPCMGGGMGGGACTLKKQGPQFGRYVGVFCRRAQQRVCCLGSDCRRFETTLRPSTSISNPWTNLSAPHTHRRDRRFSIDMTPCVFNLNLRTGGYVLVQRPPCWPISSWFKTLGRKVYGVRVRGAHGTSIGTSLRHRSRRDLSDWFVTQVFLRV